MKKLFLISLLCLSLLLCACGKAAPAAPVQADPTHAAAAGTPVPTEAAPAESAFDTTEQQAALGELLSGIRSHVTIGTAGSSLRAAAAAAELLDWASGCTLDEAGIAVAYEAWLPTMDPDMPVDFAEQLGAVDYNVRLLTDEDAENVAMLLSDAGCEDCGYPWDAHAVAVADALMQAAGLR